MWSCSHTTYYRRMHRSAFYGCRNANLPSNFAIQVARLNFVNVESKDYISCHRFWPVIDDTLRKAAIERGLEIKLLASWWNHSRPDLPNYLKSLSALSSAASEVNIEVVSNPCPYTNHPWMINISFAVFNLTCDGHVWWPYVK